MTSETFKLFKDINVNEEINVLDYLNQTIYDDLDDCTDELVDIVISEVDLFCNGTTLSLSDVVVPLQSSIDVGDDIRIFVAVVDDVPTVVRWYRKGLHVKPSWRDEDE